MQIVLSFFCFLLFFSLPNVVAQTLDVNVLTYNLLNYPNGNTSTTDGDSARAVYFREVIEDANADIIIVQEFRTNTGTSAEAIVNADVLLTELNNNGVLGKTYASATSYTGYGFSGNFIGNMLFYNDSLFNFVSQAETAFLNSASATSGNTVFSPRASTHYELTYPKNPVCDSQETTLNVFSAHLKAGSDSATFTQISDEDRRDLGAKDLIDYITTNSISLENIIIGGDFNFQGDFEPGYVTLLNGVGAPNIDPLNGWLSNIPSQVNRYTQSTRTSSSVNNNGGAPGGLDDRFDLWLYNPSIDSINNKISYNVDSYQTWGSVGVPWNGSAGDGTSIIKSQIELMSDHYPVYMQLNIDAPASLCPASCPVSVHFASPVPNGISNASISITSDGLINSTQNVTFQAGESVELQTGFEVLLGAVFTGEIQVCN